MHKNKNRADVNKGSKSGKLLFHGSWLSEPQKDPLMFANSDELMKIKNRNRNK